MITAINMSIALLEFIFSSFVSVQLSFNTSRVMPTHMFEITQVLILRFVKLLGVSGCYRAN